MILTDLRLLELPGKLLPATFLDATVAVLFALVIPSIIPFKVYLYFLLAAVVVPEKLLLILAPPVELVTISFSKPIICSLLLLTLISADYYSALRF